MTDFNKDEFTECLLQELTLAGVITESTVRLHEARELFENNAINERTVNNYHFKVENSDAQYNISWQDFKEVYLDYIRFPTITKAMAHFEVYENMFGSPSSFNKMAKRLTNYWTTSVKNPEAMDIAEQLGVKVLPSFKEREKVLSRAIRNADGTFTAPTLDDVDYGKRGKVTKGSRTISMLNGQDVVPGEFYNDISRIPKHRYTGWLRAVEKFVNIKNIKKYFSRQWKKTFIMGYAFGVNSVAEVWYNSLDSTFSLHDANAVELGKPTATLQEATRLFVTTLLQRYDSDNKVFIANKNAVAASYMSSLYKAGSSTSIEAQREAQLNGIEARAISGRVPITTTKAPTRTSRSGMANKAAHEKAQSGNAAVGHNRRSTDSDFSSEEPKGRTFKSTVKDIFTTDDINSELGGLAKDASKAVFRRARRAGSAAGQATKDSAADLYARTKTGASMAAHRAGEFTKDALDIRNKSDEIDPRFYDFIPNFTYDPTQRADSSYSRGGSQSSASPTARAGAKMIGLEVASSDFAPIQLPDLRKSGSPSIDGLTDTERNIAIKMYREYQRKLAQATKEMKDFDEEAKRIQALADRADKLGEVGVRSVNTRARALRNRRRAVTVTVKELAQLNADLDQLEEKIKPILKQREIEKNAKIARAEAEMAQERAAKAAAKRVKLPNLDISKPMTPAEAAKKNKPKKKLDENYSIFKNQDDNMVNSYGKDLENGLALRDREQIMGVYNSINSTAADNEAVQRRAMAAKSHFTSSAIKTSVLEDLITSYDKTRAGVHLRQGRKFVDALYQGSKDKDNPSWFGKIINRMRLGRDLGISLPTDKPGWWDQVKMVFRGTIFRADFVIGYSLKDQVNIEIWYITEPDRNGKNISSYYVYDVSAGLVVRRNLPYYRNALQVVLAKIGVE